MTTPNAVPLRDLCKLMGISDDTGRRYCEAGKIKGAFRTPGGSWRVQTATYNEYLARLAAASFKPAEDDTPADTETQSLATAAAKLLPKKDAATPGKTLSEAELGSLLRVPTSVVRACVNNGSIPTMILATGRVVSIDDAEKIRKAIPEAAQNLAWEAERYTRVHGPARSGAPFPGKLAGLPEAIRSHLTGQWVDALRRAALKVH